jgi:UDP-2-acetamido-2-deoxy-ribo-hexuluronate aminotransferase
VFPENSIPVAKVPFSTINRYEPGFVERWIETVKDLTVRTQFVGGERVTRFEEKLAQRAQVGHAVSCANGTDALQLSLRALGIGAGDTVLIPDLTFWATLEAVCNVGARPITLDVDSNDFHLSADRVEEALQKFQPKAVILVHLFGWLARDTKKIRELCRAKGVALVEDSAQSWGCRLEGLSVFDGAHCSTTSFYPGKVLGAAGDGGAVLTNDSKLASEIRLLANHGRTDKYEHSLVGWNSRMDVLQAEFVSLSLDYVDARIESRRQVCDWYRQELASFPLTLKGPAPTVFENGYIFVATVPEQRRSGILKVLDQKQVGHGVVYPIPVSQQPGAKGVLAGSLGTENTSALCRQVINLPCFAYMTSAELAYVKQTLSEAML